MANSICVKASTLAFDTPTNKYWIFWDSVDNEEQTGSGHSSFGILETQAVINARILSDAKELHNTQHGENFTIATPGKVFGGVV